MSEIEGKLNLARRMETNVSYDAKERQVGIWQENHTDNEGELVTFNLTDLPELISALTEIYETNTGQRIASSVPPVRPSERIATSRRE